MIRELILGVLRRFPMNEIYGVNGKYLTRYTILSLSKKLVRVKIHQFHRGDEDQELHNHPWRWAVSLILRGRYVEQRGVPHGLRSKSYGPGDINIITEETFHRVTLATDEVWTLFITGPEVSSWFFLDPFTKQMWPWKEFIRLKGLVPIVEA